MNNPRLPLLTVAIGAAIHGTAPCGGGQPTLIGWNNLGMRVYTVL